MIIFETIVHHIRQILISGGEVSSMNGYLGHQLHQNLEVPNQYLLLVKWEKLEDHTNKFRKSAEYQEWKKLLHHFYSPFPNVVYYSLKYDHFFT